MKQETLVKNCMAFFEKNKKSERAKNITGAIEYQGKQVVTNLGLFLILNENLPQLPQCDSKTDSSVVEVLLNMTNKGELVATMTNAEFKKFKQAVKPKGVAIAGRYIDVHLLNDLFKLTNNVKFYTIEEYNFMLYFESDSGDGLIGASMQEVNDFYKWSLHNV